MNTRTVTSSDFTGWNFTKEVRNSKDVLLRIDKNGTTLSHNLGRKKTPMFDKLMLVIWVILYIYIFLYSQCYWFHSFNGAGLTLDACRRALEVGVPIQGVIFLAVSAGKPSELQLWNEFQCITAWAISAHLRSFVFLFFFCLVFVRKSSSLKSIDLWAAFLFSYSS